MVKLCLAGTWKKILTMEVEIPANTSATIHIPGAPAQIMVNNMALEDAGLNYKIENEQVMGEVGSGKYKIRIMDYKISE